MSDLELRRRTLPEQTVRFAGGVLVVMIVAWVVLHVIAGVVHLIVWLLTTAIVVGLILAALAFIFGGRRRRDRY